MNAVSVFNDWAPSPYWGQIEPVQATFDMISNVVPSALRDGAESWLLLYTHVSPREILVFPFPDQENITFFQDRKRLQGYISGLFEHITRYEDWSAAYGYQRLIEFAQKGSPIYGGGSSPIIMPSRFQAIRAGRPVRELLQESRFPDPNVQRQGAVFHLASVSKQAQEIRQASLEKLAEGQDFEEAATFFETELSQQNQKLSNWIEEHDDVRGKLPKVVDQFDTVIDPETVKMLRSAMIVARYARRHARHQFDFALPGSGIWRAVERELNLSLIWHLRRNFGFAGEQPPVPIEKDLSRNMPFLAGIKKIWLNARQEGEENEFKSVELGSYFYLLEKSKENGLESLFVPVLDPVLYQYVFGSASDCLANQVEELRKTRNRFAHIRPMSTDEYESLLCLVLKTNSPYSSDTLLGKVLTVKQAIATYWKRKSP